MPVLGDAAHALLLLSSLVCQAAVQTLMWPFKFSAHDGVGDYHVQYQTIVPSLGLL
jgi:cytochrome c-type biogenesis protein CcmE